MERRGNWMLGVAGERPQRIPAGQKPCPLCLQIKPLGSFALSLGRKDGRDWRCLECRDAGRTTRVSLPPVGTVTSKMEIAARAVAVRMAGLPQPSERDAEDKPWRTTDMDRALQLRIEAIESEHAALGLPPPMLP